MIRRLQVAQCPESTNLVLGQHEAHGFEAAIGCECHQLNTPIDYLDSIPNTFPTVNNPDSIHSVRTLLATVVRDARLAKGLSQTVLAERVGKSQRWISDIERGETSYPRDESLRRLADVLGLNMVDVYIAANVARNAEQAQHIKESLPTPDTSPEARICEVVRTIEWSTEREYAALRFLQVFVGLNQKGVPE